MPGTMSIFAEALARQTGSGLTGQAALAALYEAVPTGKVKAADILPIVSQIMSERAAPKIGALRNTSMAQQARMGNAFQDWVNVFSKNGGEEGFARFFRTVTAAVEKLTPVVEGLAKAFNWFSKELETPLLVVGNLGNQFTMLSKTFESVKASMDSLHPSAMTLVGVGALLLTKWGRLGLVFKGMFLILEDIAVAMRGGKSVTGGFFDFLEKFVEFDKGIMGMAMSFLTVAAAIKLASKVLGASLLYDFLKKQSGFPGDIPTGTPDKSIPGKGKPTSPGGGWKGGLAFLGSLAPGAAAVFGAEWLAEYAGFYERMDAYREAQSTPEKKAAFMQSKAAGQWNGIDDYLAFQADKRAALEEDIKAGIITPEQAMSQMGMTNSTSNTITNTFEIKIDGVIDPANMENIFNQEILPQIEGWWTNQLGEVDISYGSK